jgi:hypothetical protein
MVGWSLRDNGVVASSAPPVINLDDPLIVGLELVILMAEDVAPDGA